jgi:hypothetical protein
LQAILSEIQDVTAKAEAQKHLDQYVSDFSARLPDPLLDQLRSSPTFRATALKAEKLAQEAAAFRRTAHTKEENEAFRKVWSAKVGEFSERVANDPLAVEVIMKAVEMESQKDS